MHAHLVQYQYHLISTLHLVLEIVKLLLRYNSNLRFHLGFLLELKVLYVPVSVQESRYASVSYDNSSVVQIKLQRQCSEETREGSTAVTLGFLLKIFHRCHK